MPGKRLKPLSLPALTLSGVLLAGCVSLEAPAAPPASVSAPVTQIVGDQSQPPFPATYRPKASEPFAIINARIYTGAGPLIENGGLLVRDGRIVQVGAGLAPPQGVHVIDAAGRWLTPGIVDPHAHIGVGSSPVEANGDGSNESGPNASGVWVEHSLWTQDPMFERALAAGVTTIMILPGSANLFNGRTVTVKNVPALSPQQMKFPGAPYGLKVACGENPTSGAGGKPSTRAGGMLAYRTTLTAAANYLQQRKGGGRTDPALETIAGALNGDVKVHIHCYRADEMLQMIDLAHEFGFKIAGFHHALEAFKIAPVLAREAIPVITWSGDWSGYKMEAFDSVMENAAFIHAAGGLAAMHSDNVMLMQHLNQEAARAMTAGQETGLDIRPEDAIAWITLNPARIIGVDQETGSLEAGKAADLILWDQDPLSVYSRPDLVFIDGVLWHDRSRTPGPPRSDFELGHSRRPGDQP